MNSKFIAVIMKNHVLCIPICPATMMPIEIPRLNAWFLTFLSHFLSCVYNRDSIIAVGPENNSTLENQKVDFLSVITRIEQQRVFVR